MQRLTVKICSLIVEGDASTRDGPCLHLFLEYLPTLQKVRVSWLYIFVIDVDTCIVDVLTEAVVWVHLWQLCVTLHSADQIFGCATKREVVISAAAEPYQMLDQPLTLVEEERR